MLCGDGWRNKSLRSYRPRSTPVICESVLAIYRTPSDRASGGRHDSPRNTGPLRCHNLQPVAVLFTAVVLTVIVAVLFTVAAIALLAVSGRRTFPWELLQRGAYVVALVTSLVALVLSIL